MRKKSLAVLLVLAMLLGLFPATALADETGEEEPLQAVETAESETFTVDTSDADLPSNDELFAEYVQRLLYPQYGVTTFGSFGEDTLPELDRKIYDGLKDKITQVAEGELASASFTLTWEDLEITKTSWTKADLGVDIMTILDPVTINPAAISAVTEQVGYDPDAVSGILDLLLVNCPYELYWFDKSYVDDPENPTDMAFSYSGSLPLSASYDSTGTNSENDSLSLKGDGLTFTFKVSKDYSTSGAQGTTDADTEKTGAAAKALENANQIITDNKDKSDYEKLLAYKTWICDNVSYNEDAAKEDYTDGYGDPWQIIYVFDNDDTTEVVCEGYAKAFQYLCDLSTFDDVVCYTVSGTMSGTLTGGVSSSGGHMWNIIRTNNQSYLVDVTNCDTGTVGAPDKLFLKAPNANGSVTDGYTFTLNGNDYTFFYYDDDKSLYGEDILTLAGTDYPVPALSLSYTAPSSLTIDAAIAPMNPTVSNGSGSYTFAVKAGSALPAGLTLNTTSGVISGAPTAYSASSVQVTITVTDNGDNDTAETTVTFPAVSKKANTVTFTNPAAQFVAGQEVSFAATADGGGEITYAYKAQNADDNTYSAAVPTAPGSYTVRATAAEDDTWQSAFATHNFTIVAKAVESIAVTKNPDKTDYVVGQTLDTAGMVVTATYNDNSTEVVTSGCTVSPTTLDTAGTQTITVTHTDSGKTATFDVTVTAKELTGITVTGTPQKEQYQAFEAFDTTGLTVKAHYNDGTWAVVSDDDYTVVYENGDYLHAGDTTVTISYQGETAQVTGLTVSKISLNISGATWAGAASVPYDGKEHTVSLTLPEAVRNLVNVGYSGTTATYVGTYSASATVTAKDAANYEVTGTVGAHSWSITPVSDPAVVNTAQNLKKGGNTLNLNTLVSGNRGAVSFSISGDANSCTLDNGILTSGSVTGEVQITVTIADTDLSGDNTPEYTGRTETITVTITEKDTAALTVSQSGWTYGDTETPDPVYTEPAGTTSTTVVYSGTNSPAKPTAAGDYTVTVTCETADTIYTGTASFTIARKDISGAAVTLSNTSLPYTGAEQTVSVTGVTMGGVPLTVTTDYTVGGTASGTDAGTYTVTVTGAGNYTGTASASWKITAKTISITGATAVGRDYAAGNTSVEISGVTFKDGDNGGIALTKGTDYTVTGAMADANAGDSKSVTVTVTLTGKAAQNYQLSGSTYHTTVAISKIDWTGTSEKTVNILKNIGTVQSGSLTVADFLGSVPEGAVITGVSPASGTIMSSVSVASGTLSYTSNANISAATAETYTVTITSTNYNNISATLNFQPTDKTPVTIGGLTAAGVLVYSGSAQKGYSGTPTYSPNWTGTPTITYSLSDGTKTTAANSGAASEGAAPVFAGSYQVTIAIPDTDPTCTGSVTLSFEIAKKPVTVAPKSFSITKGDAIPAFVLTYTGLVGGDTLTPSETPVFACYETGTTTPVSTDTPTGTYTITWTNADGTTFSDVKNYAVTLTPTGTLTISKKSTTPVVPVVPSTSHDDDDDGDYSVSVPSSTSVEGGSISVSPRSADKGDTVSITVRPKTGYVLDKLTVTTRTGDQVELTRRSETRYTFTMPAGSISVQVSFIPEEQAAEMDFADVPESFWAVNEIQWAFESGYMNGTSAVSFNPGGTVNRQQVWMILARMAGADPASMAEAKAWAVANGISDGTTPTGAVTRQQLVALLYRFAVQNGYDVSGKADLSIYPDAASVAAYASDAMSWAVANGIIGGTTAGTLNPAGDSNRAQLAVILWRFYQTTAG